ncbi:class I SAM-dependent DNA methyltransferase [Pseudodonghicola flavimaris]|uniref:Class I SAM-dependent methyltransferase n=1 Tax=Pseudodonghicola flavimaris TaxID=3050036 RepID=A0ABT7EZF1_9RHOB|nr:class I SAM-dependent methyltransferase [Pseudodonghicola flavimaris]MDK3017737.1 class I SAM-dependent methyltransferase [Pseudodonghicola flavimaris]
MTEKTHDLSGAYSLQTPEDSVALYAGWAKDYDQTFATAEDYRLPAATAEAFKAAGGSGPVLDVGAGTGLCAAALTALGIGPIDAADISPEMLKVAGEKGLYRALIEADLTKGLPLPETPYAGVVSSGTFTTGHVGPEEIEALLPIARPGALFAIAINGAHYEAAGFSAKLDALAQGPIRNLWLPEVRIYGENGRGAHKDDTALIALFEKA